MPPENNSEQVAGGAILKLEDGILFNSYLPNTPHDLDGAKLVAAKILEMCGDTKVPILVDGTDLKSMTSEARAFYSTPEGTHNAKAIAIIANTTIAKVTGTLFLGLNKPPYPAQIFTDKTEALAWLQQYK